MPGDSRLPLTRAQRALWDLQRSFPDVAVNVALYLDLHGPVDSDVLYRVGREYIDRMGTLFLRFETVGHEPIMVHDTALGSEYDRVDVRGEPEPMDAALSWMRADAVSPLDVRTDRLARVAVVRVADDHHLIYMRGHHLVADGVAALHHLNQWGRCYTDALAGREPNYPMPTDFGPTLDADAAYGASTRRRRDRQYWRDHLAGAPAPPSLSRRTGPPSTRTHRVSGLIPSATGELLRRLETERATAVASVIGLALAVYLARMTGRSDVTFALPVAARTTAALRTTPLPVSNVVPIRARWGPDDTVASALASVQTAMLDALRHQRYRYEDIRTDITGAGVPVPAVPGVAGPVLNLMLVDPAIRFGDAVGSAQVVTAGPVDDLAITLYPRVDAGGRVATQVDLDANPHRYNATQTRSHHSRFLGVLQEVCGLLIDAPETPVLDVPLLTTSEASALMTISGPVAPPPISAFSLAERMLRDQGQMTALDDGVRVWTYEQLLAEGVTGVGARAIGAIGAEDGDAGRIVAVHVGRSGSQSRAVWACLRARGALLLVDPLMPAARVDEVLDRARPEVILSPESAGRHDPGPSAGAATADAPEYVVFTSGTTGRPKGVVVPRRGMASLFAELRSRFATGQSARVAQLAAPSFDAALFEHFLAAAISACLVPAPAGTLVGSDLVDFLNSRRITHAVLVPGVLATITPDQLDDGVLGTLMTAGEALPAGLATVWSTGRELHNLYGPAETTIMATAARIRPDADGEVTPTIGLPVTGTRVHVLDDRLRPVPPNVPGELYVAGACLALGYLDETAETAGRFVADLSASGERMYRTGDVVAWNEDLTGLVYLGRSDAQVQIRGVRVELAEIESTATRHGDVRAAAAAIVDGDVTLYVVTSAPSTVRSGLRRLLADRLPPAMWPSRIVVIERLPITSIGKVDRGALASMPRTDIDIPHVEPDGATQETVAKVVADVLDARPLSMAADIVDLGATSLNATAIAVALTSATGAPVTVRDVLTSASLGALADRLDELGAAVWSPPPRSDFPPASPQQRAMVFASRLAPDSTADVLVGSVTLRGAAHQAAVVRRAIRDVMQRHEVLRTRIGVSPSGDLWQDVLDLDVVWSSVIVADRPLDPTPTPDPHSIVDPTSAVPMRISLLLDGGALTVAVAVHHALVDDASVRVLADDLAVAYTARCDGRAPVWPATSIQYADATALIAAALGDPSDPGSLYSRQRAYWVARLRDSPRRPRLPAVTGSPEPGSSAAQVVATVPVAHLGADTYAWAHTVIAAVIARFTGSLDVTIVTMHSGRDLLPARAAVGMFVNPVAVRTILDPALSFADLATATDRVVREALLHADVPVADVARSVEPTRNPAVAPLSDVLVSYRITDYTADTGGYGGVTADVVERPARDARVPLQWNLDRHPHGLRVTLTYRVEQFEADVAGAMIGAVVRGFDRVSVDPAVRLYELVPGPMGTDPSPAGPERSIVDVVLATADTAPNAIALVDGAHRYSYADVVAQAAAIGARLAGHGTGPGDRVAVVLPRGARFVVAQLGIQMTGAAYLPIDITLPGSRIAALLDDAAPVVIAIGAGSPPLDPTQSRDRAVVDIDEAADCADWEPVGVPARSEAYVLFTSGSTGRPKGVSVSHRAVVAMLDGVADRYRATDVFSCVHSLAFDFSVFELLTPWCVGASAVLVDPDTARDPAALWDLICDNRITVLSQTPSAFGPLAARAMALGADAGSLRRIVFGGEALHPERLRGFVDTVGGEVTLTNMWGITEAAVHVTGTDVDTSDHRSLIGIPLHAMSVSVLDATLHPVPDGVWGELYVRGDQLADGYVGALGRTAERFVATSDGERMYRTGDIVRRTSGRSLEYFGRGDQQVQVRGFRVELGEVAAAVRKVPGVVDAVAHVRDTDRPDGGVIVAHAVVTDVDGVVPTTAQVRAGVAEVLPSHAVPAHIRFVDTWPLTPSGKIDVIALPSPWTGALAASPVDETGVLPVVRDVVGAVLGVDSDQLDPARSLTDLGAQSLSYMHIAVGVTAATGRRPAVVDLVRASTVQDLAAIVAAAPADDDSPTVVGSTESMEYVPSPQQQALWLLNRVEPSSTVYHLPAMVELRPDTDANVLRAAALDVVGRHEILRTVLEERDGVPVARVLPWGDVVAYVDSAFVSRRTVSADGVDAAVQTVIAAPFDLAEPGWRLHLFDVVGADVATRPAPTQAITDPVSPVLVSRIVVIVLHHAMADGWSLQILGRDTAAAVRARRSDRKALWDSEAFDYRVHALRVRTDGPADSIVAFWRTMLDDLPAHLALPEPGTPVRASDEARRQDATPRSGVEPAEYLDAVVPAPVWERVRRLAERCATTPFHAVHVAISRVVGTVAGTSDVVVGVPTAGRDTAEELTGVGMYVRMVLLRTSTDASMTVREAISASASLLDRASAAGALGYDQIIAASTSTRTPDTDPYLDVIVAYAQNDLPVALRALIGGDDVRRIVPLRVPHARVPLEFSVVDGGADGLSMTLIVGTQTVDVDAARRILGDVVAMIGALADADIDTPVESLIPRPASSTVASSAPAAVVDDPVDAIRRHAARAPDARAVHSDESGADRSGVDYTALIRAVETLVDALDRRGVETGDYVVVVAGRSAALVVVMVALWEMGAAIVPVDVDSPAARVGHIVDAADPVMTLAVIGSDGRVPIGIGALGEDSIDVLGSTVAVAGGRSGRRPRGTTRPGALPAYVIYTSGSTGVPKGVVVTRDSVRSMLSATVPLVSPGPSDVWTWSHSPAFDFSVWETFAPLVTGGSIVVVDPGTVRDPRLTGALLDRYGVTIFSQTPTAFARMADPRVRESGSALRWIVFGGEAMIPSALRHWQDHHPDVGLINLYGTTETTVHLTHQIVDVSDSRSVIGEPLAGSAVRVLDRRLRPVPVGGCGDLYVSGPQVATGYLGDPVRTAERFIAEAGGDRMYRTGDVVRRIDDRRLQYLGRSDDQVQVRGHRVEVSEVEATVRAHDSVADARAMVRAGPRAGDESLIAFVVPAPAVSPIASSPRIASSPPTASSPSTTSSPTTAVSSTAGTPTASAAVDPADVRAWCAARLPPHLVPALVTVVDRWPVTASGKLDVPALLDVAVGFAEPSRPLTPLEQVVAGLVADVTGNDVTAVRHDSEFFTLGGTSLSAARLAAALSDLAGSDVPARSVFEHPSVAMLASLVSSPGLATGPSPPDPAPIPRPDRLPLTPPQEAMWLEWKLRPGDSTYHLTGLVPVDDTVAGALRSADRRQRCTAAVTSVVARHDALLTSYPSDAQGPYQALWSVDDVTVDLTPRRVHDPAAIIDALLMPFDLEGSPPWRVHVVDTGELVVVGASVHHIAVDAQSLAVLEREITAALTGQAEQLRYSSLDFASYTLWHRERVRARRDELERFWRSTFDAPVRQLRLPGVTDAREPTPEPSSVAVSSLSRALTSLAARHRTTPFLTVHAAMVGVLARRSASDDVVLGTATSGRVTSAWADTVGMFARTVPLRVAGAAGPALVDRPFAVLLADVTGSDLDAFAHADLPTSVIARIVDPSGATAGRRLSPVFLSDATVERSATASGDLADMARRGLVRAMFGLDFSLTEVDGAYRLALLYAPSSVTAEVAQGLVDDVARVLDAVADDPHLAVADVLTTPIVRRPALEAPTAESGVERRLGAAKESGAAEESGAKHELSAEKESAAERELGGPSITGDGTIGGLLAASAARYADRVALVDGGVVLTYAELDARARAVAGALHDTGVRRGDVVAVHAPRSWWSVLALWAASYAGAAFWNLNPADPPIRRRRLIADAAPAVILTAPGYPVTGVETPALALDDSTRHAPIAARVPLTRDDLAYLVYTSGSTGVPKGVAVAHRGVGSMVTAVAENLSLGPGTIAFHNYAPTFDAHLNELLPAFAVGARVVVCPPDIIGGEALSAVLVSGSVNTFFSTPAVLATLDGTAVPGVRTVVVGGDSLPATTASAWSKGRRLANLYGPSETTVLVTGDFDVDDGGSRHRPVTVGGPIPATHLYVLDHRLRPVPDYTVGELYVGGDALARGYVGRPDLTADRFVADVAVRGRRMYRTGDLVYRTSEACLVICGRGDGQLSLRGLRVEPAEIDAALAGIVGVRTSVTDVRAGRSGADVLTAWMVAEDPAHPPRPEDVRRAARELLPDAMIPAQILVVDRIPLTANGKPDRSALAVPRVRAGRPPSTPTEHAVLDAWAGVLEVDSVGVDRDADFFALGGTSLSATRVVGRLREVTTKSVALRDIFESRTVAELAAAIDAMPPIPTSAAADAVPTESGMRSGEPGDLPLAYPQRRLWFLNRLDPESSAYVVPVVVRVTGPVDVDRLCRSVADLAVHHAILRTVFPDTPGGPRQVVLPVRDVPTPTPRRVSARDVDEVVAQIVTHPFDLTTQTAFRAEVLSVADDVSTPSEWLLVLAMHHVAVDGWSMRSLCADVVSGYAATPTPAPRASYAQYTMRQRARLGDPNDPDSEYTRQLRFWCAALDDLPTPPRPASRDAGVAGRVRLALEPALSDGLDRLARDWGATVFHVVHAAFAALLARWTGRTDVAIGAPVSGRMDPSYESVVGMFVNTVVLRTTVGSGEHVGDAVASVRDTDLAAMSHSEVPYDDVARAVRPDHRGTRDPLVSVLLVEQDARAPVTGPGSAGTPDDPASILLDDVTFEILGGAEDLVDAKYDLEVVLARTPNGSSSLTIVHSGAVPEPAAAAVGAALHTMLAGAVDDPYRPFAPTAAIEPTVFDHTEPAVFDHAEPAVFDHAGPVGAPVSGTVLDHAPTDARRTRDDPGSHYDIATVRGVFADVLGLPVTEIAVDDDFFSLGGTSLSSTQVVSLLTRRTGVTVAVATVFDRPTARSLANAVATSPGNASAAGSLVNAVDVARGLVRPAGHYRIPLTVAQRQIWFADRLLDDLATPVYAVPVVLPLAADTSVAHVRAALRAVADRHAPLRTVYPVDDVGPRQNVLRSYVPTVFAADVDDRPIGRVLDHPPEALRAHLAAPFDLASVPPVRAAVVTTGSVRVLVLVIHHIAVDGQSVDIVRNEIMQVLSGRWLPPLDLTYPQVAVAESLVPAALRAVERAEYERTLDGYGGVLDLPTDRPRAGDRSLATATVDLHVDPAIAEAVAALARTFGVTSFHVWHAALVVALAVQTGTNDVAVATPVSRRSLPGASTTVGMFVSTVVVRTRVPSGLAVDDLLALVRDVDAAAIGLTLTGVDEVIADVRPVRQAGRHPLVQVVLSFTPTGDDAATAPDDVVIPSAPSQFDLQCTVSSPRSIAITYATALFERSTAAEFGRRWLRSLTAIVTSPSSTPWSAIDLRSPDHVARDAVDRRASGTAVPVTISEVLARAVNTAPTGIAIDDGATTLTYDELDRRSGVVAARLRGAGVRHGCRVAMMLPRSVESVIATWAIIRLGAVLVPVDPNYPAQRVARMIAISGARVAVADSDHAGAGGLSRVSVSGIAAADPALPQWAAPALDTPAYVVFTSGTTGTPNAVIVTHRGVSRLAEPTLSGLAPDDRLAHASSPSFDASILELVRAAGAGARLSVVAPDRVGSATGTAELARLGVTAMFATPSVLASLDPDALPDLRTVEVGGEAVPPELLRRWAIGPGGGQRHLSVVYGPTEATILACWWPFVDTPVPGPMIGEPGDGVGIAVLDERLRGVPDGCTGELYLLGPVLAQGYSDAGLTASRFVATDDGNRMYRTGDRVRRTPWGMTYVGRTDRQVQIRGIRVEPAEVDSAVLAAGATAAATVVLPGPTGDAVVTYAVADQPAERLRATVARRLPAHLVPAQVIVVEELPRTPVGKLDVDALPPPRWDAQAGGAASTTTEVAVLAVFRSVLGTEHPGTHDDFFAAGGTSLQLIPLVTALRQDVSADVSLAAVIANPTPSTLAAEIDRGAGGASCEIPAELRRSLGHVVSLAVEGEVPADAVRNDAGPVMWFVHPASGLAAVYRTAALASATPAYGLQIPDLLRAEEPTTNGDGPLTIVNLASRHLAAVRSRQPHGPYRFAGWSVGGQLAHEMSRQAAAAGETVQLLALFDARFGSDVVPAGGPLVGIDPQVAAALREADPLRFRAYEHRIDELADAAVAFTPGRVTVDDMVFVLASDADDAVAERWRGVTDGRITIRRIDAAHADLGEPETMRAIGAMLMGATYEHQGVR